MYVVFNDYCATCVILINSIQANDKKALTPVRTLQQVLELTFNDDSVRDGSETTPFTPAMSLFQSNLPVCRVVDLIMSILLILLRVSWRRIIVPCSRPHPARQSPRPIRPRSPRRLRAIAPLKARA